MTTVDVVFKKSDEATTAPMPLNPTLFVGLGGSGLKILARFRRRLLERFGDTDYWPIYGFLGIDSNKKDLAGGGVSSGKGEPLQKKDQLYVGLEAGEVKEILENLPVFYPHLNSWLPPDVQKLSHVSFVDGAGQMRSVGRLLFIKALSRDIDSVPSQIIERCRALQGPDATGAAMERGAKLEGHLDGGAPPVDVVIVSSLAGGTGAGSFLDLAYLVRALQQENKASIGDIRGMLLLPDVFEDVLSEKEKRICFANGYAALKELEYYTGFERRPYPVDSWGEVTGLDEINEIPFQVCYMFSKDNGNPLANIDEVYDLVADALGFSMSGTDLAGHMRGAWSNAKQRSYQGHLGFRVCAQGEEQGASQGSPPDKADPRSVSYERKWSTRYSSLGISSVTMKIPELQRIAGVKLLSTLVAWEIGANEDESPEREHKLNKIAKAHAQHILQREDFVERLRPAVKNRVAAISNAKTAVDAKDRCESVFRDLNRLDQGVKVPATMEGKLKGNVDELLKKVDFWVDRDIHQLVDKQARLFYQTQIILFQRAKSYVNNLLVHLRGETEEVDDEEDRGPCGRVRAFDQWADLDQHGMSDIFGLGSRAFRIIRRRLRLKITIEAEKSVDLINATLRRIYLEAVIRRLVEEEERLTKMANLLLPWIDDLKKMREDLVRNFNEDRNQVVTVSLVRDDASLDEEIHAALKAAGTGYGEEDYEKLQKSILAKLAGVFELGADAPRSFLEVQTKVSRRFPRTLATLVEIASTEFEGRLPRVQDIFERLENMNLEPTQVVSKTVDRARAYWPLLNGDHFRGTIHNHFLAGAVEPPTVNEMMRRIKEGLEERRCTWLPSATKTGGASVGEIVVVNEAHGYSILGLENINLYKQAYEQVSLAGDAANRHLDFRRMGRLLPDLTPTTAPIAIEDIQTGDYALLGILLHVFQWNSKARAFRMKDRENARWVTVGVDYQAISRWMRSTQGRHFVQQISNSIIARLTKLRQPPEADSARTNLSRLLDLDLVIELWRRHIHPTDPEGRAGASHTRLRRISNQHVGNTIENILHAYPDLTDGIKEMRRSNALDLHLRVEFVGNHPDATDPDGARVPVLLPRGEVHEDEGGAVKEEALGNGWFPALRVASEVPGLFPDQDVSTEEDDVF